MTSLVDFFISAIFLVALMMWYHYVPPIAVLFLPMFVLLVFSAALGVGLWVAALMVEYRDFRFIVPFLTQFGLYVSPVGFQSSVVPERFRLLYAINPMAGIIDGFRWSLLGRTVSVYWPGIVIAVVEVIILVGSGFWYFRKTERTFADVI
jgi:lipopolysaccharide transport system permease protein